MPADRTKHTHRQARKHASKPSNARAGPSTPAGAAHRVPPLEARDGLMGVSKIKAQLRQTKRLLARDNLEPGLRVATQRRLTSLEADLAAAERRAVEKKNGAKYHAVKFFERQKVMRVIKRVKREIEDGEGKEVEKKEKEEKKKSKKDKKDKKSKGSSLADELEAARVMLNYILHYPNTKKYIALFAERPAEGDLTLPPHLSTPASEGPAGERYAMLLEIREGMRAGKIAAEPENEPREARKGVVLATIEKGPEDKEKETEDKEVVEEDDFFGDDE